MIKDRNYSSKQSFFITATNTDVGKTYAAEKFLRHYASQGFRVGYFKPCETGVTDLPLDGSAMLKLAHDLNADFKANINDVVPYQFKLPAAPYVAKGDQKIDINLLLEKKAYLESMCDVLIIEGAGGLLVPIEEDLFVIDLIKLFETKAILISPSKLGSINDTLLSMEALKTRNIEFDWYINLYADKESFEEVTLPYYNDQFPVIKYLDDLKI